MGLSWERKGWIHLLNTSSSLQFSSVTQSCLWTHGPQHTRPPCPSPTPGAYSNSCWFSRWCPATISFSVCYRLHIPPSIFPSIRIFSNESVLHIRWPKYWSFSFSISPSNEHPGLISFRMDWLDWRGLTECGPLEKGIVNHFNILALRTDQSRES